MCIRSPDGKTPPSLSKTKPFPLSERALAAPGPSQLSRPRLKGSQNVAALIRAKRSLERFVGIQSQAFGSRHHLRHSASVSGDILWAV